MSEDAQVWIKREFEFSHSKHNLYCVDCMKVTLGNTSDSFWLKARIEDDVCVLIA